jgi:hypothetical protein
VIAPANPLQPLPTGWRERLVARWPDGARLDAAWRLARDLETLADLLAGLPVAASRLDPDALVEARRRSLVQLRAPFDLVDVVKGAA